VSRLDDILDDIRDSQGKVPDPFVGEAVVADSGELGKVFAVSKDGKTATLRFGPENSDGVYKDVPMDDVRLAPSAWAARDGGEHYDISGFFRKRTPGQEPHRDCLGRIPPWAMYSYEAPAYTLWSAIAGAFHKRGWTDAQIRDWMQSKATRHAFDGSLGEAVIKLGEEWAATVTDEERDAYLRRS
jgi:hypothetical protein